MKNRDIEAKIIQFIKSKSLLGESQLKDLNSIKQLSRKIRDTIIEELSNELAEKGFNNLDEPNNYGLELEDMIDLCNFDVSDIDG
jgi:hypothetical protein